ncbi:hypothetical protein [Pseudomonas veronii]|uniref:Transmembrane protein n=1 Tax=Pseudomonas veronii TaxID=76761 RepID=A0A5M8FL49_PSEVE|nr:hypothetical protein [Pseudomonas veronii]KAA6166463.1 hypothetical protein F3K54_31875 [Pseudomonas veronii]KAA6185214.1 hypothetical protein F3K53_05065 [Pseudomonas veronii]
MLRLLKKYLELTDWPILKSFIFTFLSFLLCILPILFIIAGEVILYGIHWLLQLLPALDWGWLSWLLRKIAWIIENITLLAMPTLVVVLGVPCLWYFARRASLRLMIATYIFKRTTEPLLALHFAAVAVNWLTSFTLFESMNEGLLNTFGVKFTVGSGQMVIVTVVMWFLLTLALNCQLKIIRKEKAVNGESGILESIRLLLLERINKVLDDKKGQR